MKVYISVILLKNLNNKVYQSFIIKSYRIKVILYFCSNITFNIFFLAKLPSLRTLNYYFWCQESDLKEKLH